MGPAFELFLLVVLVLAGGAGLTLYLTRNIWRRAAKTVIERDREEREVLEEQARERSNEAEARRKAEDELHRALRGEDVPGSRTERDKPGEPHKYVSAADQAAAKRQEKEQQR